MGFIKADNGIFYIHTYYPKRYEEHKGISEKILDFKRGYTYAIDDFTNDFMDCIDELNIPAEKFKNRAIAIVPSHTANTWSPALLSLADQVCNEYGICNMSKLLIRYKDHDKQATGGIRSIESQLDTIRINKSYIIDDKIILVIDDVTTSGSSILACCNLIDSTNAKRSKGIAIAKTY